MKASATFLITTPTVVRTEEELVLREKMIARIEGYFGCLGVWHEWDTKEMEKLHEFVVKNFLKY